MSRFILSGAVETEVDGAGRILMPEYLKEFADLKSRVVLGRRFGPGRDLEREDLGGIQAPHRERRRPNGADAWAIGDSLNYETHDFCIEYLFVVRITLSREEGGEAREQVLARKPALGHRSVMLAGSARAA